MPMMGSEMRMAMLSPASTQGYWSQSASFTPSRAATGTSARTRVTRRAGCMARPSSASPRGSDVRSRSALPSVFPVAQALRILFYPAWLRGRFRPPTLVG